MTTNDELFQLQDISFPPVAEWLPESATNTTERLKQAPRHLSKSVYRTLLTALIRSCNEELMPAIGRASTIEHAASMKIYDELQYATAKEDEQALTAQMGQQQEIIEQISSQRAAVMKCVETYESALANLYQQSA